MKRIPIMTVVLFILLNLGVAGRSQIATAPPIPTGEYRSSAELDQLLGPVALYPDPLIAEILPAATLPAEIVVADRYLSGGGDPNAIDAQPWDPSIKAIARYPSVLKFLDDNLSWTTELGQAFLAQQQDVMDSIQHLRSEALALGNLQSNAQENVINDNGTIEILPAEPQVIYVPSYQPDIVYYQRPYGRPVITFGPAFPIGGWLEHDFDWRNHHLLVWGRDNPRPPNWWARRPGQPPPRELARVPVWRPESRPLPHPELDRGWGERSARSFGPAPRSVGPATRPEPPRRETRPANFERARTPTPSREVPSSPNRSAAPRRESPPVTTERPGTPTPTREIPSAPTRTARTEQPLPSRPATTSSFRPQPAGGSPARPASGALVGVQSSRETAQFSSRGQSSRMAAGPPAGVHSTSSSQPSRPPGPPGPPSSSGQPGPGGRDRRP